MANRRTGADDAIDRIILPAEPTRDETLVALAGIPSLRSDLDAIERGAIDAARRSGASWTEIAGALGLSSRQAAEQRRLRLDGPSAGVGAPASAVRAQRRRQQNIDKAAGTVIIALRASTADLAIRLNDLPPAPAIQLAQATLRIAADADPGALVDLARLALADLAGPADLAEPADLHPTSPSIMELVNRSPACHVINTMIDELADIDRVSRY